MRLVWTSLKANLKLGRLDSWKVSHFALNIGKLPWVVSSRLGDDKFFIGPKHNIYALLIIMFGLVWYLFVCQIVKCEFWNRKEIEFIFKKANL